MSREAGSRERRCTGRAVCRGRQEAGSDDAQDVRYVAGGRKPVATMHRTCGMSREAGSPLDVGSKLGEDGRL